jgi:tetratricopeptide (TPR) repeat protein
MKDRFRFAGAVAGLAVALAIPRPALAQTQPVAAPRVQPAEPGLAEPPAETPDGSRYSRQPEQEITFQEGLLHYSRRQLDVAERNFRAVIAEDPADAEAYYYLGLTQLDSNRPAEAVESFNQSLRLDPTSDEVRAARAAAFIRVRRFDDARQDLAALEMDPRWAGNVAYLRGQLLYAQGDLEGAASYFREARRLGGTEAAPAKFYEGLTYLRMKELVRARSAFREAGVGYDRDPTVAAASRQLDAVLARQQQGAKPWEVQVNLGYEFDSNVIQIGNDIALPTTITDESDTVFVVQPRGSYSVIRKGAWDIGLEAAGYYTYHDELSDFDIVSHQGGPFLNYRLRDNLYASVRYGFNYLEFGHEPYMNRHIATPQLTWVQPKFGYTSGFYQYQHREFSEPVPVFVREGSLTGPLVDVFDRDGDVHTVGVVQGITLPELFEGAGPSNLEVSYRYERQLAEGSDFDAHFNNVGVTFYTPLPLWKMRADVGASVGFDLYDNPNSTDNNPFVLEADDDEREDLETSFSAGLTRELTKWASVRVDYTFTDNDSNVEQSDGSEPYSYDRHVVGVRLILSY